MHGCKVHVRCNMARRSLELCIDGGGQTDQVGGHFVYAWGVDLPPAVRACVHMYYAKDVRAAATSTSPWPRLGLACRAWLNDQRARARSRLAYV